MNAFILSVVLTAPAADLGSSVPCPAATAPVTTHTYVYPTTAAPGYGVGVSWTEQGGVFTPYGACVGGSCAAPGSVILGAGAARGFAGYSGGGWRPLGGIFRRR